MYVSKKCDSDDNKSQFHIGKVFTHVCIQGNKVCYHTSIVQAFRSHVCFFHSEQNLSTKKADNMLHSVSQQNRNFYGKNFNLYIKNKKFSESNLGVPNFQYYLTNMTQEIDRFLISLLYIIILLHKLVS